MKVIINGTEYVPVPFRPEKRLPLHTLFAVARRKRKETYKQVSEETGISISTIFKSEGGGTVSILTAIKLCRHYRIDMETMADSVETMTRRKGK